MDRIVFDLQLFDNISKAMWTISGTTATCYDDNGKVLAILTGLKSGLKVVNGKISGIEVINNENYLEIILSNDVLDKDVVTLNSPNTEKNCYLGIAGDINFADFDENSAWHVSGTNAVFKAKVIKAGYCVRANGRKIEYFAKDSVIDIIKFSGISGKISPGLHDKISGIYPDPLEQFTKKLTIMARRKPAKTI